MVESGDLAGIRKMIDKHTSSSQRSPFLSASFSPKLAQVFSRNENATIYKIEIDANRVILDADNLGQTGRAGEILILGKILPEEIVAMKINNELEASELLYRDENGHDWVANLYHDFPGEDNFSVRDPINWSKDGR